MLFVFLTLYVALGVACILLGARRRKRSALWCGIVTVALAAASFLVWVLYALGATHWTVSVLQVLLSPMPESVLQPGSLENATQGSGLPVIAVTTLELIVAIALWAIPVVGIVVASGAPRGESTT